tara:strand:+ start:231 stop:932 length:702 start_codon:yes stop_codon:yes gene_type:complete
MKDTGWVKLHRKLKDNPIFYSDKGLRVWLWCLLKAGHKNKKIYLGNQLIELKIGEFVTGRLSASEELKISPSTFRNILATLKEDSYLDIKTTNKYSIITILNWSEYQNEDSKKDNRITSDGQQNNTNKNVKNVKKTTKGEKISKKLVNTLLQERRLQRPDGDYARDNIYPARTLSKMLGVLIKERTGKEATDDDKIDRFKYIINHLSDFDLPNATKISYFTRNWNRIINKLKE